MRQAVFLDRDDMLVEAIVRDNRAYVPLKLSDFALASDAGAQVKRLLHAGFTCVVFTNQPEVARGLLDAETLDGMRTILRETLSVEHVYVCPHDNDDVCACRKHKPGMLFDAAHHLGLNFAQSDVVRRPLRDIDAGRAARCLAILFERAFSACETADRCEAEQSEAVDLILAHAGERDRWSPSLAG